MINSIRAVSAKANTTQVNTTQSNTNKSQKLKDFNLTDDKITPLELELLTLPVSDPVIMLINVPEWCTGGEVEGVLVNKETKEETAFHFKLSYTQKLTLNSEYKFLLDSFKGNIANNQVKINGTAGLTDEALVTKIEIDNNNNQDSFKVKITLKSFDVYKFSFSNVISSKEGALKEEEIKLNLLDFLLTGKATYYETTGKILGIKKQEKLELEYDGNETVKGTFQGEFGNNNITGILIAKGGDTISFSVEKDLGSYLIKYTHSFTS